VTATYPKTNLTEIKHALALLYQTDDVVELRALDKNERITAGFFNDFTKLATIAARLSDRPDITAVYIVPNPIKRELLARAANRLYADKEKKDLTKDIDITRRRWLLIDPDAKRVVGISSTDAEHESAIARAYEIKNFLIILEFNLNSIIVADSGNGAHVLVRIDDIAINEDNAALIKSCIAALKAKFQSDGVEIDAAVVNPARVWKLYGTICKKGDNTEDRPHRVARLLEVPSNIVTAPTDLLKKLAALAPQSETSPAPKTTYISNNNVQRFDVETWMAAHGIDVVRTEVENGRTKYILKVCPFNPEHNNNATAAVFKMANGALGFKCQHNGCVGNDWQQLRELLEPEYAEKKRQYALHEYKQAKTGVAYRSLTDVGNAYRMLDKYGDQIRYNYERKLWLIWNTKYWEWDDGSEIMRFAQQIARSIYSEITEHDDEDTTKAKAKWAATSENNQRLCAMIAQTEPLVSIKIDQLDRDEWLLNCKNGTINLKTGKLQPHNPVDLITRVIDTDFDQDATSEEWIKFLNRIFESKTELITYIQRALGYSITGNQGEQAIFFCNGSGWNGKSTLLGVIRKILVEYAAEVEPSAFMVDKARGTGPNEAIASLYKMNFVTSTEIEDGQKLSTSLLKRMTGGESLRCERKFEHGFNFKPQYKLWLCGNHEPEISDTTNSIWNRLKKIPFTVKISAEERVKDYDTKLVKDHDEAILAWLVKGCLEWQKWGLGESPEVTEATQAYRDNQDVLHDFLSECCLIKGGETIPIAVLYKAYTDWCEFNGDKYFLGKGKFNSRLSEKGFIKVPGHGNKTVWRGLRILTEDEKVNWVNLVKQNSQSSLHEDNSSKVTENQLTLLTKLTNAEAKAPIKLEKLGEKCPVCGKENIEAMWADDESPNGFYYYCIYCYPNAFEDNNND